MSTVKIKKISTKTSYEVNLKDLTEEEVCILLALTNFSYRSLIELSGFGPYRDRFSEEDFNDFSWALWSELNEILEEDK